jgi:hypothetical protein
MNHFIYDKELYILGEPIKLVRLEGNCNNCRFWIRKGGHPAVKGVCKATPVETEKLENDWCGQYKEKLSE